MKYVKYLSILLIFAAFFACNKRTSYVLSISIFNSDESIPSDSKLELYDVINSKNVSVSPKNKNQFELDISKYGIYFITLSNEKNESCFIPVFSDGERDLTINSYLPSLELRNNFVPKYEVLPRFVFADTTSAANKIAMIYSKYNSDHSAYMDSLYFCNINNGKYINKNSGKILVQLKNNLAKENIKEVREMLYVNYLQSWSMIKPDPLDSAICANALNEIKPTSAFWSFGGYLIRYAIWSTKNKDKYIGYINEVIRTTNDPNVKSELLYARIMELSLENKNEEMMLLIDKLKKECPNTYKAKIVESEFLNTSVGKAIPDYSFISIDNPKQTFSKSTMIGKIYLLDFWGTWCTPCVAEMPTLHKVYEKYKSKGFEIISVASDEKENVTSFRNKKWRMPWLNTVLLKNEKSEELLKLFGVYSFPSAFLVSAQGIILARNEELRGENLEKTIKKYLE
ncbi:MAG: TlpA disulfide reductase family protein [Ignavibacteria bacterium]|nr:TlpA disulfide reductase family protein [Ignavibacteria bacterium]